ncbi:MAG: short chain dehydrogenase family protein [Devosia sp.]|nr:short chain dehydrogenase family protein [Devosia sp.]
MSGRLSGRVVLVTGSSSGIGLATARAAQAEGAEIMLHGIDEARLEAASAELGVPFARIDLAEPDAGRRVVEATLEAYGRIDAVVNNAGLFPRGDLAGTDPALFDLLMAVNARAPLFVIQRAVEAFRVQGTKGAIVNIGSVNAYAGQPDLLAYSMSKGALITMTRNLADALAPEGIRVNQLNCGWVLTETEIETQRAAGRPDDWPSTVPPLWAPTGALLSSEMVAHHVLFWLSDASAPVTGQVYEVEQTPFLGRTVMSRVS